MDLKQFFITGIGTEVGKTLISTILTKALDAFYWKPIQCGLLPETDSQWVAKYAFLSKKRIIEETYNLKEPCSPHQASKIEGKTICLDDFILPSINRNLIVEGAGGCLVPLNKKDLMVDLINKLNIPTIIVSQNYLGSINHTLTTVLALKHYGVKIKGLIFNGKENASLENFISQKTDLPILLRIDQLSELSQKTIEKEAQRIQKDIQKWT